MEFRASAVLPAADLARATSGLRGQLWLAIAVATPELPDWDTLTVDAPTEVPGPAGRCWVRYTAAINTRPSRV
jgi:uncharacterized membrane-anchored protein